MKKIAIATIMAFLAAIFYAVNSPVSKLLLASVGPTFLASFLYLGAGFGIGFIYLFKIKGEPKTERLTIKDLPYTIGMIVLDIAAPILLMLGLKYGTASNASLIGNFEIVATSVIALIFFKEKISLRLWVGITFVTLSTIVLSFDGSSALNFSIGSLFVLAASICWGLENNCTRSISEKSTYEIVTLKGIFSGLGSFIIALVVGEKLPSLKEILVILVLGFVSYGLSIFLYVRAQRTLGAAKTSTYYAVAPFVGAGLSFLINGEKITLIFIIAASLMAAGTVFTIDLESKR